jgi:Cu(I)/Ag(I) efflux system membrane protein CusA/SilA
MFRDENGLLSGYVYVDISGRDLGSFIEDAKQTMSRGLRLPAGHSIAWSGQYEAMARVCRRLTIIVPLTLFLVMMLLYLNTRSAVKTMLIVLAVPFSAAGAIWLLYLLGYNMSIGVWVGLIALLGVDAETAVFMLLYLDIAYEHAAREGRLTSLSDLR